MFWLTSILIVASVRSSSWVALEGGPVQRRCRCLQMGHWCSLTRTGCKTSATSRCRDSQDHGRGAPVRSTRRTVPPVRLGGGRRPRAS